MDAAGKDSTIEHVMSGINPRAARCTLSRRPPKRSSITISSGVAYASPSAGGSGFQLPVLRGGARRTRPPRVARYSACPTLVGKKIWDASRTSRRSSVTWRGTAPRYASSFARLKEEQRRRFQRLDDPRKNWKFSIADLRERERWHDY
jgi:hypothetical protein